MSWKPTFLAILVFTVSGLFFRAIPTLNPYCMTLASAAALATWLLTLGWNYRRYIHFSLLGLVMLVLTLQIPIALLINPWKIGWLSPLGGLLLMFWLCGFYVYALDRGLSRYVRERSLARLKAEETKGIGKL